MTPEAWLHAESVTHQPEHALMQIKCSESKHAVQLRKRCLHSARVKQRSERGGIASGWTNLDTRGAQFLPDFLMIPNLAVIGNHPATGR